MAITDPAIADEIFRVLRDSIEQKRQRIQELNRELAEVRAQRDAAVATLEQEQRLREKAFSESTERVQTFCGQARASAAKDTVK